MIRVIYVSRVARHVRFEDAEAIAAAAATRNAAKGVTGLLLYTPSHFLQVLEGPEPAVREVLQRIARDPRHSQLRVISDSRIEERRFGAWAMRATWLRSGSKALELDKLGSMAALDVLLQAA